MSFLEKIFSLGTDESNSIKLNKKIRLLNKFCLFWFLAIPIWMTEAFLFSKYISILIHFFTIITLCIILYFNRKKKIEISTVLFFMFTYFILIYFSYFGSNLGAEFGFILLTPLALVFYDDKRIILSVLVISFLTFWLPHYFFSNGIPPSYVTIIPNQIIYKDPLTKFIIFIFISLIVAYFKKLNHENEILLVERNDILSEQQDSQLRFFINIAHEIRTPITIIKGNAEQFVIDKKGLSNINYQVNNLDRLVNDIIDISKIETNLFVLNKKEVDLTELITKVYQNFETNFSQKKINYSLHIDSSESFIIDADQPYLEKVIYNLLSNSLKFTPQNQYVKIVVTSDAQKCLISVTDTGLGIPIESQPNIFKRFYQANNGKYSFGGSGIGLFFSNNIVTLHNGKMDFTSEYQKETTFTVSLPFKKKKKNKPIFLENQIAIPEPVINKEYDILLVEDNQDMQYHLENMLTEYSIFFADNGRMAIESLKNNKVVSHLIITDYMMPEMNGLEFIKELQTLKINTPVIVLSALSDQFKKQELFELGIYDYILKPFNINELKAGIKNCIIRKSSREELKKTEIETDIEVLATMKTFIKPYYDYVYNNSHNSKMSVQNLCDEFLISQSTLYRKIKSHSGMNPQEFIIEIKLKKVRHLIELKKAKTIKQILSSIGWSNSTYLCKMYKNRYGVNLRDYFTNLT